MLCSQPVDIPDEKSQINPITAELNWFSDKVYNAK